MNRSPILHGCYTLITLAAFFTGSQLAQNSISRKYSPSGSQPAHQEDTELTSPKQSKLSSIQSRDPDEGHALLARDQLIALVLGATRSPDPLERRRAFDRILQGMESGTFTTEQSLAIRSAMFENGADTDQWKLFDYAWGRTDPEAAVAHIETIPERFRDAYLANLLPGLASSDPQAAIELFARLDSSRHAELRSRLYEGLIDHDIITATEHIFNSSKTGEYDWRPMDTMTREIVKDRGLIPTLEWAAELPDGPLRGNAWSAAYAHWAATEPHSAIQSIIDLPESADRNQAINGFISAHAHQDGETAAVWAAEISQPGLREEAMVRAARQFYRQDPEAAAQWFSHSDLPQSRWPQVSNSQ